MRNVFLDSGDTYQGNGDIAVNAGFLNGARLSEAKHSVYYAWSKYRDIGRRYEDKNRLERAAKGTKLIEQGVHLGEQALVFDDIAKIAGEGDYRNFARIMDQAMKEWNVIPKETGYVDGKLISETGEIIFDPENACYAVQTPYCGYYSGAPKELISLSDMVKVKAENKRITLALIAKRRKQS